MDKKKTGEVTSFLLICFSVGLIFGSINKSKFKKNIKSNSITLQNYINRLREFDLTEEQSASDLFLRLTSIGFDSNNAFDIVVKECIEVGEKFDD